MAHQVRRMELARHVARRGKTRNVCKIQFGKITRCVCVLYHLVNACTGRNSSVGIATCYGLGGAGIESQWPSGSRRGFAPDRLLELRVRIPPAHVCVVCCTVKTKMQNAGQSGQRSGYR